MSELNCYCRTVKSGLTVFLHSYFMILQVKVLIIDSVSFLFRQDFDDLALRTRILSEMSLKLMKLAKSFNLAVSFNKEETFRFSSQWFFL